MGSEMCLPKASRSNSFGEEVFLTKFGSVGGGRAFVGRL
jgi:hypothetical protein